MPQTANHPRFTPLLVSVVSIFAFNLLLSPLIAQSSQKQDQRGEPLSWIKVPNGRDEFYLAQTTPNGVLRLTANESFFPKLGLVAKGEAKEMGNTSQLNQNKNFQSIVKWDTGDEAEWGLFFEKTGKLNIEIHMGTLKKGRRYTISVGNQTHAFTVPTSKKKSTLPIRWRTTIKKPGRYSLLIRCEKDQKKSGTVFRFIKMSGSAASKGSVLRKRWRPRAAHARFSSSSSPKNVRLWIVEMDAAPGKLDFYAPMTTPFGYYGPTWLADGRVNTNINFSLWSFKRGQKAPPTSKLSHLLAIGNKDARFGAFDHEGTGVKVRNWAPFAGRQGQKQVLALRVEPGENYDTYFSYFFDSTQKRWCFFSSGRKTKSRRLGNLLPGSFVEVPGRAHVQRTGAYVRCMRYRGWVVDDQGTIHPLDRMTYGDVDKDSKLTYTHRGVDKDGRFFLQTGGWTFRKKAKAKFVNLPKRKINAKVDFLGPENMKFLSTVPSSIEFNKATRKRNQITIELDIRNLGKNAEAFLYAGPKDELTFAKIWSTKTKIVKPQEGKNKVTINSNGKSKKIYLRLFLRTSHGQFWSTQTLRID